MPTNRPKVRVCAICGRSEGPGKPAVAPYTLILSFALPSQLKRPDSEYAHPRCLNPRRFQLRGLTLVLTIAALVLSQTACVGLRSNMRRHPAIYGIAAGAVAGVSIGLATRHTCPPMINGYRYDGTPPCPNPASYDPGGKHETTQGNHH